MLDKTDESSEYQNVVKVMIARKKKEIAESAGPYRIQSIERAIEILNCFSFQHEANPALFVLFAPHSIRSKILESAESQKNYPCRPAKNPFPNIHQYHVIDIFNLYG